MKPSIKDFYPRPPRGGRPRMLLWPAGTYRFLSTPSARRATVKSSLESLPHCHFYPRPPRGGRPPNPELALAARIFLSTPSARRATVGSPWVAMGFSEFLSTPSARRATIFPVPSPSILRISIHALREEGDPAFRVRAARCRYISIHALREEGDSKNGEKHLRFCFIIKRSAQNWKSLSKNIRKNSCDLHRTA